MNGSVAVLVLVELKGGVIDEEVRAAAGAVEAVVDVLQVPKSKLEVVKVVTVSPVLEDPKWKTAGAETVDTVLAIGDPK